MNPNWEAILAQQQAEYELRQILIQQALEAAGQQ
jgi:hypothetical protein